MSTALGDAKYVNLATYRKNGTLVETPVWVAPLGDKLIVLTRRQTYKVKRVQNNPKVRVAPCDVRGKLRGDWVDGTCVIITDKAHEKRAHDAFRKKYGITALFADIGATVSGGVKHRTWMEITLTGS